MEKITKDLKTWKFQKQKHIHMNLIVLLTIVYNNSYFRIRLDNSQHSCNTENCINSNKFPIGSQLNIYYFKFIEKKLNSSPPTPCCLCKLHVVLLKSPTQNSWNHMLCHVLFSLCLKHHWMHSQLCQMPLSYYSHHLETPTILTSANYNLYALFFGVGIKFFLSP